VCLVVLKQLFDRYLVEVRYVGAEATRLPRNVEANPAVYGPGGGLIGLGRAESGTLRPLRLTQVPEKG